MPVKWERSGSTLRLMPCRLTHRRTRMPIAAILSSRPAPSSGRRTQTPMRSSRRSPATSKRCQRPDEPFLEIGDVAAHVAAAPLEIEHEVDDALAGPVIGELPAASGVEHGKAPVEEILRPRAGAGGVEGRVLEEPDELAFGAGRDGGGPRIHRGERLLVGDRRGRDPPRRPAPVPDGASARQRGRCGLRSWQVRRAPRSRGKARVSRRLGVISGVCGRPPSPLCRPRAAADDRPCTAIADLLHPPPLPRRRTKKVRRHSQCGRGGIGRRASLRC